MIDVSGLGTVKARLLSGKAELETSNWTRRTSVVCHGWMRIQAGEYGYCVSCGDMIPPGRLHYGPAVATCIGCAFMRHRTDVGDRKNSIGT